jgi:lipoprotein-anchoring transpeptidase ErfK/SrfK
MIASRRAYFAAAVFCVAGMTSPASAAAHGVATGASLATAAAALTPGNYVWNDSADVAQAPVSIVVSLTDQRAYVYRGTALVAVSAVSTGKQGHETPIGSFTILQKAITHHSNKYEDAPMPYMERLTWDGVAIHGGMNPGYPASHGCVRVPLAFAKKLYAVTRLGAAVTITDDTVMTSDPLDATELGAPALDAMPTVPAPTPLLPPDLTGADDTAN